MSTYIVKINTPVKNLSLENIVEKNGNLQQSTPVVQVILKQHLAILLISFPQEINGNCIIIPNIQLKLNPPTIILLLKTGSGRSLHRFQNNSEIVSFINNVLNH